MLCVSNQVVCRQNINNRMSRFILPATLLLILAISGCRQSIERQVIRDEIADRKNEVVMMATLRDGSTVRFDQDGASYFWMPADGAVLLHIVGVTDGGARRTISVADIAEARLRSEKADAVGTILTVATITTATIAVGITILLSSWHH
jgi:hypothetical protein